MTVDLVRRRSRGVFLATAASVFVWGCSDPTQNTDLRPEGPPEVLSVLVMTDAAYQLNEQATFCAVGDDKRPDIVGLPDFTLSRVCADDLAVGADMVTTAYPDGWYVRLVFDELLDPNVEELVEIIDPDTGEGTDTYTGTIANTRPVVLECESVAGGYVEVPYDGYYSPAGNRVTWPLGPSLVIKPLEPRAIATTKMCRVTLNDNVLDKSGEPVPAAQRGPFEFQIAPITPIFIDPADGAEVTALQIYYDNVYVQFNTYVNPASFCDDGVGGADCEFALSPDVGVCSTPGTNGFPTACDVQMNGADCPTAGDTCDGGYYAYPLSSTEHAFGPNVPVETEKEYTFAFPQGGKVVDRCGVENVLAAPVPDLSEFTVTTLPFTLTGITPTSGDTASPLRKPVVQFNNVLADPTALVATTNYTLDPPVANASLGGLPFSDGEVVFYGDYQPATSYTLTLKANTKFAEFYGKEYELPADRVIMWTTAPIALTGTTPANNGTSTKATANSPTTIRLTFNQNMDPASLTSADYTASNGVQFAPTGVYDGCDATATSCVLELTTTQALTPGAYQFTLNAGATLTDVLGNTYTQATDRVINFTVANAAPAVQCL